MRDCNLDATWTGRSGEIRIGALLHDIGKIGIADNLLQTWPTDRERIGNRQGASRDWSADTRWGFAPFLAAVELHHENGDCSGYPHGYKGDQRPIDARIIQVADAYDAMTTHRSYRRGLTHEEAVAELAEYAGTQFDPRVLEAFVSLPREVLAAHSSRLELVSDLADSAITMEG